jgi:hypothetical protein
MNTETEKKIYDSANQLIEAIAFPGNTNITIALYKSLHYLYSITINFEEKKYRDFEFLAQSRNNDCDYLFKGKNDPDTVFSLRYINHDTENDIHAFLIRPEYQKINTGELLKTETDTIPETN